MMHDFGVGATQSTVMDLAVFGVGAVVLVAPVRKNGCASLASSVREVTGWVLVCGVHVAGRTLTAGTADVALALARAVFLGGLRTFR